LQQTPTGRTGPRRSRPCDSHHRALRSSPTRRSSDLKTAAPAPDPAAQNRAAAKPAKAARGKAKTPEVTVTLSGTADGEWTVEVRSEEHTSELQSRENLVCRLLLEKKKSKSLATARRP